MAKDDDPIGTGYPFAQLLRSLRASALERAARWEEVIRGLIDGTLAIGSRTPVQGTPAWVTLEVIFGGFATGRYLAGLGLDDEESRRLATLPPSALSDRARLNAYYLGTGRSELDRMLAEGLYRIDLPEEAALLVTAWLEQHGADDRAAALLEVIGPWLDRLRFYPRPRARPRRRQVGVSVRTAGELKKALAKRRPSAPVERMRLAARVLLPLYDRVVRLFLETVEGESPSLRRDVDGQLARRPDGQPIIDGGWPCRRWPADWKARAQAVLATRPKEKPREGCARLLAHLATAARDPSKLTGHDVAMVRQILAGFVTRYGAPGSSRHTATRQAQAAEADRPSHALLARALATALGDAEDDAGTPDIEAILDRIPNLPEHLQQRGLEVLEAPLAELIDRGLIGSSETIARLVPGITAQVRAAQINDPGLSRLYHDLYLAFRKRRSLLLTELGGQVKLSDLPWVAAIEPWVGNEASTAEAARAALIEVVTRSLRAFPHTITPNKLVTELRSLYATARIDAPLVNELAADIFLGRFSGGFLAAAKIAARRLRGTLYERYYDLPFAQVLALPDVDPAGPTAYSSGFGELCVELVGPRPTEARVVAYQGAILERAQWLTTHNLAVLFDTLTLEVSFLELARRCFSFVERTLRRLEGPFPARLRRIKDAAYAFRQMVYYLSSVNAAELASFLEATEARVAAASPTLQVRLGPLVSGLAAVAQGQHFDPEGRAGGGLRFTGWSLGRHWLVETSRGSGAASTPPAP